MFFRFQVILLMKNKSTNQENIFVSEEEKTIVWIDLQSRFKKILVKILYKLVKKYFSTKEYNDYLILGVPTRFLELDSI